eukprot:scaffold90459_cov34-Tisochrysis_lutea.AAC.4
MASTSRLTVWLALAACAGVQAWVCPTRPVELTRVPTPLMKGRKQGDGPAKSSRKSKKTPVPLLQRAKVEAAKKRRAKAESALTPTLVASAQGAWPFAPTHLACPSRTRPAHPARHPFSTRGGC